MLLNLLWVDEAQVIVYRMVSTKMDQHDLALTNPSWIKMA